MTKKFTHTTEDGREIHVQIYIQCHDQDGCDATYDIEWVGDHRDDEVKLNTLSPRDQTDIDRHAQDLADENGPDAWHDWMLGQADALHDQMKDGD